MLVARAAPWRMQDQPMLVLMQLIADLHREHVQSHAMTAVRLDIRPHYTGDAALL